MIGYCPLASGSRGNSIYVGSEQTKILIDAGISYRQLALRLNEIGVNLNEIDAILITHEHADHIRGLATLTTKHPIPIFANSDTAKGIQESLSHTPKFKIFSTGEPFAFGEIEIHPFSVQHDTLDPVAFTIHMEGCKLGFCTDLGFVTTLVIAHLKECDYLYLEANHEPSMVHASRRPTLYKQRVLSRQGHLSNEQCADLLASIYHNGLKHVHLAHLSQECNSEELALKTVGENQVELSIAYQDKVSHPIVISK